MASTMGRRIAARSAQSEFEHPETALDRQASWLDEESRRVSREIFTDPEIHALEIERIFNRTWLFLGHESEIEKPGQFVRRRMGADEVVVTRGKDGVIRAFLNACLHRGAKVCRADSGTAPLFVCPYHAWTYDATNGTLQTTSFDREYDKAKVRSRSLRQVPLVDSYHGMIFGCWNADAPSLREHLGDLAWYLDVLVGCTPEGSVVLSSPQRWVIETNWKVTSLNFMDGQHAMRTHKGPLMIAQTTGRPPIPVIIEMAEERPQVSLEGGHGTVLGSSGPPDKLFHGYPQYLIPLYEKALKPDQLKCLASYPPFVGTMFPNLSWVGNPLTTADDEVPHTYLSFRLWQPIGPDKVEVWSWCFAPKETTAETKVLMRKLAIQNFGPAGRFEEDDAEVWSEILDSIKGSMASRETCDLSGGIDKERMIDTPAPGNVYKSAFGEQAQFGFVRHWNEMMKERP
jgi:phenylpropionate dioxygenase-like ring-hydroxylating dioxygenase large terminal subunit